LPGQLALAPVTDWDCPAFVDTLKL
jgi:hypothetical protein